MNVIQTLWLSSEDQLPIAYKSGWLSAAKQKEMLELDKQVAEGRDKFLRSLNTLQSAVNAWKIKYVVTAPVEGRVFFSGVLQENQSVVLNQELLYVAPPGTDYLGELRVPQQNAGKVRVG